MSSAVERTDKHVREYLIYRGFTGTLKQLDSDIKADKEKGFRVDKIIDQLQQLVQSFDLFWSRKGKGNLEKTQEFFQKQALELQGQAEWRDWFILPFIPAPEQNPAFSPYFSRQWADTFLPVLLSFDAEVQKMTSLTEENEQLRQKLFALQTESRDQKEGGEMVQHKLPLYVQNMDRLGDTELDLVSSQRAISATTTPSRNFFSTFLPQGKRTPVKTPPITVGSSPSQAAVGRKESSVNQMAKSKEASQSKEVKAASNQSSSGESASSQSQQTISQHSRHKRIQEHEKERKELFSRPSPQTQESKGEDVDLTPAVNISGEPPDSSSREEGGLPVEQPFIKLSQEEYGEHHSSIMHCRVDSSGRRVASLDVDGVIKVWSFNPIMQTKATIMSKSPLLSLEWATKPDRLLLLGSGVGTVRLYDTDAKKNLYEMNIDETHPRPSGSSFVCSAAALSRSGSDASVPRLPIPVSGQLLLWDTKTVKQQLQFSLEPEPVAINCTAFNHNGNLLVTGAADGVIRLFDMQRYESAMSWRAHDGEVYSVEFSYDENTVFSVGEDGKFIQWNIHRCGVKQSEQVLPQDATGPFVLSGYSGYKQVQVPRGRLFAFDSEGQHVLTCSSGGGLIYRLTNDEPALERVLSLGGHKAPVVTVDWCSAVDCGTCLTASMDGKIKLSTLLAQKS
ncbi:WD repeat-containing protein 91 [Crenichthys baileyi]|uniref:WD repeat-containing protein 91 n=1 Tax=Crenichthys baileyi TaxID=28760 RepID=A0AAV9RST8_9TELE